MHTYTRGMEHREGIRKKDEKCVFNQHNEESHNSNLTPSDFGRGHTNPTRPGPRITEQTKRVATGQPAARRIWAVIRSTGLELYPTQDGYVELHSNLQSRKDPERMKRWLVSNGY